SGPREMGEVVLRMPNKTQLGRGGISRITGFVKHPKDNGNWSMGEGGGKRLSAVGPLESARIVC
ncbi:MAG: hypothetical protein ACLP9L_25800, partial [Thermoguttaceae bacterium]